MNGVEFDAIDEIEVFVVEGEGMDVEVVVVVGSSGTVYMAASNRMRDALGPLARISRVWGWLDRPVWENTATE